MHFLSDIRCTIQAGAFITRDHGRKWVVMNPQANRPALFNVVSNLHVTAIYSFIYSTQTHSPPFMQLPSSLPGADHHQWSAGP